MALAAIVISAVTLVWTIGWAIYSHRRATAPRISTRAAWSFPVYELGGRSELGDAAFSITATNTGPVAVTISNLKFFIRRVGRDKSVVPFDWVAQVPSSLPLVLKPGDHWTGLVHARSVKESLDRNLGPRRRWQVRPVVSDTADRRYDAVVYRIGWRRFMPGARRWLELEHDRV
jgi:hypothetical protein